MSSVTYWWKAYQNTSGHCYIFTSAAGLIVSFIVPIENAARPSSFEPCGQLWAGLLADCLCQIGCVYLGRPWHHLLCCRAQCQSRCWGWCSGRDSEGLGKDVRDAGLDKGLTKVLYFTCIPAYGYCLSLCYKASLQGWINVRFSACMTWAEDI